MPNFPQNPYFTVLVSTFPPTNPTRGLLWFNTIDNSLKVWVETLSGSSWRPITGSSSSLNPTVKISVSPPSDAKVGDLWFDTSTGFFNLKFGEGSTQWISPTQGPPGPPGPPGPIATRLDQLVDVNVVNRVDQSLLYYDSQSSIFKADSTTTSFTLTDGGNF